jgi:hypothetical protein
VSTTNTIVPLGRSNIFFFFSIRFSVCSFGCADKEKILLHKKKVELFDMIIGIKQKKNMHIYYRLIDRSLKLDLEPSRYDDVER